MSVLAIFLSSFGKSLAEAPSIWPVDKKELWQWAARVQWQHLLFHVSALSAQARVSLAASPGAWRPDPLLHVVPVCALLAVDRGRLVGP